MEQEKLDGAKLVSAEIIGLNVKYIIINDKSYVVESPTIHKLAGAGYWLSDIGEGNTLADMFATLEKSENLCRAMSWLIQGNDELWEELSQASLDEVVDGLCMAYSMVDLTNFLRLSDLVKSVKNLIAKRK